MRLYDLIVDEETAESLKGLPEEWRVQLAALDPNVVPELLAQTLTQQLTLALESLKKDDDQDRLTKQLGLANQFLKLLRSVGRDEPNLPIPTQRLLSLQKGVGLGEPASIARPSIPLTSSDLLVNGRREPSIGHELQREIASADRIDLIVAFLKFSGLQVIRNQLQDFLQRRPGQLRVLTTAYMGATEKRAVDELSEMGADIRISYDVQTTRLHAKAWLFYRDSGFTTAYIGSSNLSHAALHDGLEWNVRLSAKDSPTVVQKFQTTFDQYWQNQDFEPYLSDRDSERLREVLKRKQRADFETLFAFVEVHPKPHQKSMLEALASERQRGHTQNLVVAATGTGKTLLAAFDYKRLVDVYGPLKLLFIAHRQEILKQSVSAFRLVMRDGSFGELLVAGNVPDASAHVFASIQSLHEGRLQSLQQEYYDYVVVDEFHHAEASTYKRLLQHLKPRWLVGLTATPERADGQDVRHYFQGRIAAELRLWDALEQNLLSPFQYFGIADQTDLGHVKFSGVAYDRTSLANVLTGDTMRARRVVGAVQKYVVDPMTMKALGFCVSIEHAKLMATTFNNAGLRALAVHANSSHDERQTALHGLKNGEIQCIFAVDLFNEGVDIPSVDTVLFLRPTESGTVFLQQLGRGLRLEEKKACLTVLDFVGNAHKRYRYDLKFRALLGGTKRTIETAIEEGFPYLPPGCTILLEKQAQKYVLDNIKSSLTSRTKDLVAALREFSPQHSPDLLSFLNDHNLELADIYSKRDRAFRSLCRDAGIAWDSAGDESVWKGLSTLQFVNDYHRIRTWQKILERPNFGLANEDEAVAFMQLLALAHGSFECLGDVEMYGRALWQAVGVKTELQQVLAVLEDRVRRITMPCGLAGIRLNVHATYSRNEVMATLGQFKDGKLLQPREGVVWAKNANADLFFVTLKKSEKEYSPKTLYRDFPVSERVFHWESQHQTSEESPTGQRYVHHKSQGSSILLFVREERKTGDFTLPYTFLGPATYVKHTASRPMQIEWRLDHELPADLYQSWKIAAG